MTPTHEVTNQVPPLEGSNPVAGDRILLEALEREGANWARERLLAFGDEVAGGAWEWGFQANAHPPVLRSYDRAGRRIDEVEYHPAYHALLDLAIRHQVHALPWSETRPGAQVARAALLYSLYQVDPGVCCPVSMTFSAIPALRHEPDLLEDWQPRLGSSQYDRRMIPVGEKTGATCGMAMTEKQGGSDVRANTTQATPLGDGAFEITGHKWFCSAPMSDAFLVLAQAPAGLSCFLLPRWRPDGRRNGLHVQRLKDKLGDRSNASSEVEFDSAWAERVGPEGRGVATIIEMVNHTRLDCIITSAGVMRQGVAQAVHHALHRKSFGKRLVEHALMQNVLADLCLESEAATLTMMRLARAYDEASTDGSARRFARIATAVLKYWTCKRAPVVAAEALECLGGNGFVEERVLARAYRQAPLNSIWEGSGNVICLDVLRALGREPEAFEALFTELADARGRDDRYDVWIEALRDELTPPESLERRARRVVERLALALQAATLLRFGAAEAAEAFCATRLGGDHGLALGTLPVHVDTEALIERSRRRPPGA